MGVKISKDTDIKFKKLFKRVKDLEKYAVKVGIMQDKSEDGILMIARVHEYGVEIDVTPKMRGYLHYIGLHLKPSTKTITIPERSFMRAGFDEGEKGYMKFAERLVLKVLKGELSAKKFYDIIGKHIASDIQKFLVDLSEPPLSSFTKEKTGRSNPLVNTGKLRDSIKSEVVKRGL